MRTLLVLLPGLDGSGDFFSSFIHALPASVDTQIISYPDDACTSYQELVDFIQPQLPDKRPFYLIAESFSGPAAIEITRLQPRQLKGVVLAASFCFAPLSALKKELAFNLLFLLRFPMPVQLIDFVLGNATAAALAEDVKQRIEALPYFVLRKRIQSALEIDLRGALDEIAVPCLVLTAKHDRLLQANSGETIEKYCEAATLLELDGPHFLLQTQAKQAADAIVSFFKFTV